MMPQNEIKVQGRISYKTDNRTVSYKHRTRRILVNDVCKIIPYRTVAPVSCYLIILHKKHYVFYRALYNCTNRIHQALRHTLFRIFLIQMKPVCDAFLDLFSDLFSLFFF